MTPSMGMAAPKGTQAPAAGLAAIAQPAQAPKGMSSGSMQQVMSLARKMSDAQLAEVLQGKSLDVPQYVAMTEAMGRKSLRTAMQGQQAMAQAQQPSVKDKLLMGDQPQMQGIQQGMPQMPQQPVMAAGGGLMYADGGAIDMNEGQAAGGLAELPAPNMEGLTLASGGIVAFEEGGEVPRFNGQFSSLIDPSQYVSMPTDPNYVPSKEMSEYEKLRRTIAENQEAEEKRKAAVKNFIFSPSQRTSAAMKSDPAAKAPASKAPAMSEEQLKEHLNNVARGQGVFPEGSPALPGANLAAAPGPAAPLTPKLPPVVTPGGPAADKEKAGLGATDEFASFMDAIKKNNTDYLSELKGASAKQREGLAKLKSQGGGEALMAISKGLLSKGTLAQGVAEGLPGVMAASAGSRKEQIAGENAANEMDFNLAKARQAAAKGDMESALMFKRLADEASYRKDSLAVQRMQANKPDSGLALLNALGDPKLMERYKEMQLSKKPTDIISKADALKAYNDRLEKDIGKKFIKQFPTFESYYNDLSTKAGSGGVKFLGFE